MRRSSIPESFSESNKIVTKMKAVAVAKLPTERSCGLFDELSYERCSASLVKELQKPHPRQDVIEKLLRLTFSNQRKAINGAPVHISSLIEQYPFFKIKKWN